MSNEQLEAFDCFFSLAQTDIETRLRYEPSVLHHPGLAPVNELNIIRLQ